MVKIIEIENARLFRQSQMVQIGPEIFFLDHANTLVQCNLTTRSVDRIRVPDKTLAFDIVNVEGSFFIVSNGTGSEIEVRELICSL